MAAARLGIHSTALKYPLQLSKTMDHPCTLKCHHGGTCSLGKPLHGFQTEELEDELGALFPSPKSMHCVCPRGFTGLHCEIKLVECPSSGFCFNDDMCRVSEDDAGHPFSHCECDGIESDLSPRYASHFCGDISRVSCQSISGHSFCQNGGRCRTNTQDSSPGCECTPDWEGPHCEFIKGTHYSQPPEKDDKFAFSLYGFAIALLILAVVGVVAFAQKRRRPKSVKRVLKSAKLDARVAKIKEKDAVVQEFERNQLANDEESYESDEDYESSDESERSGDEYESDDLELNFENRPLHGDPTGPTVR